MLRTAASITAALVWALIDAAPARAADAVAAPLPACPTAQGRLVATIDTKVAVPGDRFAFVTLAPVSYAGRAIPAGTPGTGVVMTLDHSKSHGEAGYLVLEARYLQPADGPRVPVSLQPGTDGDSDAYVRAGDSNAPVVLGYVPYVGIGAGVYNYFHHGKDAALVAGTMLSLVVGDDLAAGTCAPPVNTRPLAR